MRTLPLLLLTAFALFAGDTLSQHDRDFAMSHMHASRKLFLDAVAGLTPEQWNFKPGPDRWSVAECAEHIAISEDFIAGITAQLLKSPAAPEKRSQVAGKGQLVGKIVPEPVQKFQAAQP